MEVPKVALATAQATSNIAQKAKNSRVLWQKTKTHVGGLVSLTKEGSVIERKRFDRGTVPILIQLPHIYLMCNLFRFCAFATRHRWTDF